MTTVTESEIKELKDLIIAFRDDFKAEIKEIKSDIKRIEIGQMEIRGDIKALDERLTGQVKTLDERLTGQIKALDEKLTGEIKTVSAKLDGLGKRLENQEFLSRSVMVGLILAFAAGLVKLFFPDFPGNP
jgi:chromosome segregation ATPase